MGPMCLRSTDGTGTGLTALTSYSSPSAPCKQHAMLLMPKVKASGGFKPQASGRLRILLPIISRCLKLRNVSLARDSFASTAWGSGWLGAAACNEFGGGEIVYTFDTCRVVTNALGRQTCSTGPANTFISVIPASNSTENFTVAKHMCLHKHTSCGQVTLMAPSQEPSSAPTACALPAVALASAALTPPPLPLLLLLLQPAGLLLSLAAAGVTVALLGLTCSMVPLTEWSLAKVSVRNRPL